MDPFSPIVCQMNVYIHILILQNLGYGQLTVKSGIWDIGGYKIWDMGYWGVKNLGYGILGGKKSGIWDMGTPVSPPPPYVNMEKLKYEEYELTCLCTIQ